MKASSITTTCALAAVVLCAAPGLAGADGVAAPPTEEAKLSARLLAEEGDRLYDVADFVAAAEKYKAAYLLFAEPELLFSLGECFWNLRNPDKATFFYRRYLAKKPDALNRPMVEGRLAELDRLAGAGLGPLPPPAVGTTPGPGPGPVPAAATPVPAPAKRPLVSRPEDAAIGFSSDAPPPPKPGSGSLFNKWWFWAGLSAVALGVGVTAIVIATQQN